MEDKDTLEEMFMDMGKANEWATKVMAPDGKYWTDQIDNFIERKEKTRDEYGWSNLEPEYKTLWEFLGDNPGKDLGMEVFNASVEMGVKSGKKMQSGSEIKYRCYPIAWLEMWFRDYDARLSMEVYNKAKAKEALSRISNKNK